MRCGVPYVENSQFAWLCISVVDCRNEVICDGCAPYCAWEASTPAELVGVYSGRFAPVGDKGSMVIVFHTLCGSVDPPDLPGVGNLPFGGGRPIVHTGELYWPARWGLSSR